eukprot:1543537-Prymnesium_polylepis.3
MAVEGDDLGTYLESCPQTWPTGKHDDARSRAAGHHDPEGAARQPQADYSAQPQPFARAECVRRGDAHPATAQRR